MPRSAYSTILIALAASAASAGTVEGRMIKRQECWEQKLLLPMHEHRFLIADHNLPGPSECEGPRHVPGVAR